jgi:hypothetical protein
MLDETLTKRGAAILFCTEFVRPNFVQLSSNFRPTFAPFRSTFVQLSPPNRFVLLQKHTGHGMQALLLPRKQQKRGGILCRKSGCGQMLPLGIETEMALPYLFRFAPFFNASAASYLGHRNFSFFDCIARSKNKSFLLILTIATNLTFGSSVGSFGGA